MSKPTAPPDSQVCAVDECDQPRHTRIWCQIHYGRWKRHGDPLIVLPRSGGDQTTHGMRRAPIYRVWDAMIQRCTNPRTKGYQNYGGRGIKVCDRWRDFAAFYADMGDRPPGMTLDRINNDGDYEPGNCRWATWTQQRLNQRPRKTKTTTEGVRDPR